MVICANGHDNLGGLSHCRVCGLPLLDLPVEFAALTDSLACRSQMGRCSPRLVLIGLGTAGAQLVDAYRAIPVNCSHGYSYLTVDAENTTLTGQTNDIFRLKLSSLTSVTGTFCGIGEATMRNDPHLVQIFRQAGLNRADPEQAVFLIAGLGGGIGSTAAVGIEKSLSLNPDCHTVALAIVPGVDESFHNHLNAYYGLSRLLENGDRQSPDLIIVPRYDHLKRLRGVGTGGQELATDGLTAAFADLLIKNLSFQHITEIVRINKSMGVKIVVPCLALGRSLEIFGGLANILESAISCPANHISRQSVLVCHLLLRVPESQAAGFEEETINERLWTLIKRHLPGVKGASSSVTYSSEQHDRIQACILLGGGSAASALFADDGSLTEFQKELEKEIYWETYGLSQESIKKAGEAIAGYDHTLDRSKGGPTIKKAKVKRSHR